VNLPRTLDHLRGFVGLFTIRSKSMQLERLDLNGEFAWAQEALVDEVIRQYNEGRPVRIIVLKARQLGMSTASAAVLFNWMQIFPGSQGLTIAHDTETSQSLFEKIQTGWDYWPFNSLRSLKHSTQRRLTWAETGSSMRIATANNVKSGRGRTIQALHASEVAFWEDPETLMTGLAQTIPNDHGTIVIMESTANGIGNYWWSMWQDAVAEENDYVPLFFPWYHHPEYQIEDTWLTKTDLDEYEYWLYQDLEVDLEHIAWRRWAIQNLCHGDEAQFKQEYPATAAEAFLTTGRHVFPLQRLAECYRPMKGQRCFLRFEAGRYERIADPLGPMTIFRWPGMDEEYMVAGDPSRTIQGDPACIQVINRRSFEQVAVWHGQIDPVSFADELAKIGRYYNNAVVTTEIEGGGYATIGALVKGGYPRIWQHRWADKHQGKIGQNFGWSTNYQRKHWAVGDTIKLLSDRSITIHDEKTYNQMVSYQVINQYGEMGGPRDGNDDAVMAFVIGICCTINDTEPATREERTRRPQHVSTDIGGVPPWEAFE
jgi:hypothetical protein